MNGIEQLYEAAKIAFADFANVNEVAGMAGVHPFTITPAILKEAITAYEAEHSERSLPIDGDWLCRIGAVKEDHPSKWRFTRGGSLPLGLWTVDDGWKAMLIVTEQCQSQIVRGLRTRGDVLDLLTTFRVTWGT